MKKLDDTRVTDKFTGLCIVDGVTVRILSHFQCEKAKKKYNMKIYVRMQFIKCLAYIVTRVYEYISTYRRASDVS